MSDKSKTALPMADANGEWCQTCRFFLLIGNYSEAVLDDGTREVDGICRRFPPGLSVHAIEMLRQGRADQFVGPDECSQPGVWGGDWCGEWQAVRKPAPVKVSPDDYHTQRDARAWVGTGFPKQAAGPLAAHFNRTRGGATFSLYDLCSMTSDEFGLIRNLGKVKAALVSQWLLTRGRSIGDDCPQHGSTP